MSSKSPEIEVNTHYPTGRARVSISVWVTANEGEDLIQRITSRETIAHDRKKVVEALQLVNDETTAEEEAEFGDEQTISDQFTWEVSLVE